MSTPTPATLSSSPTLHWTENDQPQSAHWRSERGAPPPKKVVLADDTMNADTAYRLACEGTALLWRGDFHNARQLLQALTRRIDKTPARKQRKAPKEAGTLADAFHLHRQAQAQRARVLNMLLVPMAADYSVPLRRAPNVHAACLAAWGPADLAAGPSVITLRELQGLTSAHEWRRVGIEIPALGAAPQNRIHPHYGVFSPVRGEYIDLVAHAPLPADTAVAFDIGTGSGVLAAVLARRGVAQVVATDQDPRALACARANLLQLGVAPAVQVVQTDMFPEGQAQLIVCNPPWLPARPGSPIEHAVYDEGSRMLLAFLAGLKKHLAPGGEGWLIISDLAEHLGLRTPTELQEAFAQHDLQVLGRLDAKPQHPKATDATAALHAARAAELTTLWRLAVLPL